MRHHELAHFRVTLTDRHRKGLVSGKLLEEKFGGLYMQ